MMRIVHKLFKIFLAAASFAALTGINTLAADCPMADGKHEVVSRLDSVLRSSGAGPGLLGGVKQVRFVYISPSDEAYDPEYAAAITDAVLHLQDFYQRELGNDYTFEIKPPDFMPGQKVVDWVQSTHDASWFVNNPNGSDFIWYFLLNTLDEGYALTGNQGNDYIHVFLIDVQPTCCQGAGGTGSGGNGYAVLTRGDLRGLVGGKDLARCLYSNPWIDDCPGVEDEVRRYRFIGGLGHEMGHALGLPHSTPGCNTFECVYSIMDIGYREYPSFLKASHKTELLNSIFVSQMDLRKPRNVDFDIDRKADFSVWKTSVTVPFWHILRSSDGVTVSQNLGASGDKLVPGDYDGDRIADMAVWRPSNATFYIRRSSDGTITSTQWGATGDIPVPKDYDGDLVTDLAIWSPSAGIWLIHRSASATVQILTLGQPGDIPVPADYNGDKRADIAIFRPSTNEWHYRNQYSEYAYYPSPYGYVINPTEPPPISVISFGLSTDKLVPGDYDGDGMDDLAVFRPSTGDWRIQASKSGNLVVTNFGQTGDVPVPGDYDNDGKTDIAIWRARSVGIFYVLKSSDGTTQSQIWGSSTTGDIPIASAYVRP